MPSKKKVTAANSAFQIKVQLIGIEPEIWRRIIVPGTLTLRELHAVLQGAMGWQDYHLHMFEIEGKRFEVPENDKFGPEDGYADERKQTLAKILTKGMEFLYVYDFGDNWKHLITVEDVAAPASARHFMPRCIAGTRACPPEDCGGDYRYPEFLDALADPGHPEHRDMVDWAGGFEPEVFSLSQANALIGAVCALYAERGWGFRQP
ncbi:plasmid pRiA4b ORF-3 family protein [Polymorphum gilvum]|uniref:Phage integrase / plasmid pRiA4b ORF-3-like protein n=1 Tax=Polymorphum gilvum (strain LMG 25793 / CGMCC 1.9160 / SL003B-26A1) TaxID=991905 RepID=F2IUR7_POLGS|nr:plasmid pRiA4b ORF-3 family protein [Polymorphum gilvum]ADZ69119.1 Phage integrase / plasmid pRiA4b ORF-3-like protein [Polymorphum gilvum SL003B-26A1]